MDLPRPTPGFDDPLGVLRSCHDRIARYARLLRAIAEDRVALNDGGAQVQRYFSSAGVDHHQDEEQDLFPILSARGAAEVVTALAADHLALDQLWSVISPAMAGASPPRDWRSAAQRFVALNEAHIALENDEVLPLAARILTPAEIRVLGMSMAKRRGIILPDPSH